MIGIPYARAGVGSVDDITFCTAACPACDYVALGPDSKSAARVYAAHWAAEHQHQEEE